MKMNIAMAFVVSGLFASTSQASTLSLDELREQVLTVARDNMTRTDNFSEVRERLDGLVDQITEYNLLSDQEKSEKKVGAWHQLWTDDVDDSRTNNPFSKALRDETYQVVFEDGIFFNISTVEFPFGVKETAFLRAIPTGSVDGTSLFSFSDLYLVQGQAGNQDDLISWAQSVENGEVGRFSLNFLQTPNGPIGAAGAIETVYIDDQIRIDEGYNFEDGVVDLFILERE